MNNISLPNIIEKNLEASSLSIRAIVPEKLWCFPDHFPAQPIVPGYLQLVWLSVILKECLPTGSSPKIVDKVKYHSPLQPGQEFLLKAKWNDNDRSLSFAITSGDKKISSGRYHY